MLLWPVSLPAGPHPEPFQPGEKLSYTLKWELIPVGSAVLEVAPVKKINRVDVFHFIMTARTNSFADIFYKVRDRVDAYTDLEMASSVFYKKKQREGSHRRDVLIEFDRSKNEAHYTNFNKKEKPISIPPGTFDPLSAFYYLRRLDLKDNLTIELPVTDGKKLVVGKAVIVKREKLTLPGGVYDTFLVEPDIKDLGGVFQKSKNAKIQLWVSADPRHLLVKIKSRVIVGSFVGELTAAEGIK
ncbi:MAG: DUF3108 domain-containing protein [Desulfobacterales bacterium]|nr:DUF3108 domain-containing protein [Desulfobacterales bacterium]